MTLSCSCEADDPEWWYTPKDDFAVLTTKRSRKCCSCGAKIKPGDEVLEFDRWRSPNCDIEERIHGDEVEMASWYMCETCGGLYFAIEGLGMCCDIGDNIAQQIKDFREWEREESRRAYMWKPRY